MRAAEAVDRLRVVAYHHQVAVPGRQSVDDLRLNEVCVLIFIDHDVLELGGVFLRDGGILRQEFVPEVKEIVKVHQIVFPFALDVEIKNSFNFFCHRLELRIGKKKKEK